MAERGNPHAGWPRHALREFDFPRGEPGHHRNGDGRGYTLSAVSGQGCVCEGVRLIVKLVGERHADAIRILILATGIRHSSFGPLAQVDQLTALAAKRPEGLCSFQRTGLPQVGHLTSVTMFFSSMMVCGCRLSNRQLEVDVAGFQIAQG